MKVLVVGSGGREHALAWKLSQSPRVSQLYCAPGNAGLTRIAQCVKAELSDPASLVRLAEELKADLTVVGPELPLVLGIADQFADRGLKLIGPSRAAAEIEASKTFAKQFMQRQGIPSARFSACSEPGDAYSALCSYEFPVVIKADGLAAGKGVRIADTPDEATALIEAFLEKGELGPAGERVVIEEYLEGEELSFIILTDGERIFSCPPSQDHKRVFDEDRGPNTGGMGAFSDDSILDASLRTRILEEIVTPTLRGLTAEKGPYRGFLYVGLMLTDEGPKVLEYNCRMGDPECQALLLRLESDLAEVLEELAGGRLPEQEWKWSPEPSACVVLASAGYPGYYETGKTINGLDEAEKVPGVVVFHAGTRLAEGRWVTAGGRVLGVSARGTDLQQALDRAYAATGTISFEGIQFRRDIGAKGLKKLGARR